MPPITAKSTGMAIATNTIIEGGKRSTSASGKRFFSRRSRAEPIVPMALRRARSMATAIGFKAAPKEVKYFCQGRGAEADLALIGGRGSETGLGVDIGRAHV